MLEPLATCSVHAPNDPDSKPSLKYTPAACALPVNDTLCGLPDALSATSNNAVRTPDAVGAKLTDTEQLPPATNTAGQLSPSIAKSPGSAPPNPTDPIRKSELPAFVNTTTCGALVVWADSVGKLRPLGLRLICGPGRPPPPAPTGPMRASATLTSSNQTLPAAGWFHR